MASHAARAAVSRTLRTLLLDRMVTGAQVTLAPPDQEVSGADDARVNLYLMQVIDRERPPEESGASRQGASRDFPASSVVAELALHDDDAQPDREPAGQRYQCADAARRRHAGVQRLRQSGRSLAHNERCSRTDRRSSPRLRTLTRIRAPEDRSSPDDA